MKAVLVLACIATASAPAWGQEKQVIRPPGPSSTLPFSPAIRVGNVLYLSGQIGRVPDTGQLAPGGTAAEVRQTLENVRSLLERAGSSMERVIKCTVFLADIADYTAMNEVYATYFTKDPPARSTVAVAGLAGGASVEIECMALAG